MTIDILIRALSQCPADTEVYYTFDGVLEPVDEINYTDELKHDRSKPNKPLIATGKKIVVLGNPAT